MAAQEAEAHPMYSSISGDKETKLRAAAALVDDPTMSTALGEGSSGADQSSRQGGNAGSQSELPTTPSAGEGKPRSKSEAKRALMPTSAFKQNARISRSPSGRSSAPGKSSDAADAAYERLVQQRMADKNVQQLRGIFAGFDLNRDNALQRDELVNALLSLGVKPTQSLLDEYFTASKLAGKVDLRTFIDVSMKCLQEAGTVFEDVLSVFTAEDGKGTGRIGVPQLRHLLQNVQTGTQLTATETEDFLKMIGISDLLSQATRSHQNKVSTGKLPRGAKAPSEGDFEVNYAALIDDMLFVDKEQTAQQPKGVSAK